MAEELAWCAWGPERVVGLFKEFLGHDRPARQTVNICRSSFFFKLQSFARVFATHMHSLSRGSTSGVKQHIPKKMFVYNSCHTTQFEVELCDCFIMCRIQRLSLASEAMR